MLSKRIHEVFRFEEMRENQAEVLDFIMESIECGYKYIGYRGPTGFGKTPCNIAACDVSADAYYSTPLKSLQQQVGDDFGEGNDEPVAIIMGRDNYPCYIEPDKTAATSICSISKNFKCESKQICPYFVAFGAALSSKIMCPNLALLMGVPIDIFGKRSLAVIDECHELDEWGLMYVQVSINSKYVGHIPIYKTFAEYVDWIKNDVLSNLKEVSNKLLMMAELGDNNIYNRREYRGLSRTIDNCELLVDDFNRVGEDWIFTKTKRGISFEPITSGRFLKNFLWNRADRFILSSATFVNPDLFMKEVGLEDEEYAFKYVKSTFPIRNRYVYRVSGVGKFGHKEKADKMPDMVKMIKKLMQKNKGTNGIIHAHSYENAIAFHLGLTKGVPGINTWLNAKTSGRMYELMNDYDWDGAMNVVNGVSLQTRGHRDRMGDFISRDDSLHNWIDDQKKSLFISVNYTKGLNLIDGLARYQIMTTIPYPSLGNKRVKYRVDRGDNEWYVTKTIETIEQAAGRGVRTPTDYCKFYITDGRISFFIKKNKALFSQDFLDSVKFLSVNI